MAVRQIIFPTIILLMIGLGGSAGAGTTDEAVLEHMLALYELDTTVYEIEILSNPLADEPVAVGEFSIRALTRSEPLGLFTIVGTIERDGEEVASGQIRMRVRKFESVLVLVDRVQRDRELRPEMFELRRKDVTDLKERALTDSDQLVGFLARRNLRRGQILVSGDLAPIPDIRSGSEVSIVYQNGFCRVTAPGQALQTGLSGDYIKVKNMATKKIITARIMDGSEVQVDP